jgi:hypothetical protein
MPQPEKGQQADLPEDARNKPSSPPALTQPLSAADATRLRESMDRLFGIYREIARKADQVITTRCPYKDARSRCTAHFGCRNQYFTKTPSALPACTGSDKLDYRSAWDA